MSHQNMTIAGEAWWVAGFVTTIILGLILLVGWTMNLIALASATGAGEIALRVIGIFIPFVGGIVGYL